MIGTQGGTDAETQGLRAEKKAGHGVNAELEGLGWESEGRLCVCGWIWLYCTSTIKYLEIPQELEVKDVNDDL